LYCIDSYTRIDHERRQIGNSSGKFGLRVLNSEKAHVGKQVASGVMAIAPAGLALGIVTGTEGDKLQVASGDYNDQIDKKIAEIKSTCGL
jgi:hypothetical protein